MKNFTRIISVLLILSVFVALFASCTPGNSVETETRKETESSVQETESLTESNTETDTDTENNTETDKETDKETVKETDKETQAETVDLYHDTNGWEAVPMISKELRDAGFGGGEGCQAVLYVYYAPTEDGQLAFMGTDVGGIYKSVDGGDSWYPCSVGFQASGATGFACDPMNTDRVFCVGTNAGGHYPNGLWLSEDAGETWNGVYNVGTCGFRDVRNQIGFDTTTYNEELGYSMTVYWAREKTTSGSNESENAPGIYKSVDGGYTWRMLEDTEKFYDSYLFVNPEGKVIISNSRGVYVSEDGGETWNKVFSGTVTSMDCILTRVDNIYITTSSGFYVSTDLGETWNCVSDSSFENVVGPNYVRVSPVNPNNVIVFAEYNVNYGKMSPYYSKDGGVSWHKSARNSAGVWVPNNTDWVKFSWSPVDENTFICNWCYMCKSVTGGASIRWSNTGYNGICPGGRLNFNVNNNNLMYFGSQDYNGGFSTDGGYTWKYMAWEGKSWGGFTYGGYVIDENTVVTGNSQSQSHTGVTIWMTFDGGNTFVNTRITAYGEEIGCGVLGNNDIAFFAEYRTDDGGHTWTKMTGCTGVYTVDYKTGALFGVYSGDGYTRAPVVSTDEGLTWTIIDCGKKLQAQDMAYNYETGELWITHGTTLHESLNYRLVRVLLDKETFEVLEKAEYVDIGDTSDTIRYDGAVTVCNDPNHPNIMYVGCRSTYWYNLKYVWRSMDGGVTWECLSRQAGDGRTDPDGGVQPGVVRVNKETGDMFCFCACRGVWKVCGPKSVYEAETEAQ